VQVTKEGNLAVLRQDVVLRSALRQGVVLRSALRQ
jgi:hypothetical protein